MPRTRRCWSCNKKNLLRYPDRKLLMLNIDSGGVQSRRILDRLLAAEQTFKETA